MLCKKVLLKTVGKFKNYRKNKMMVNDSSLERNHKFKRETEVAILTYHKIYKNRVSLENNHKLQNIPNYLINKIYM